MTKDEALKLALEALEIACAKYGDVGGKDTDWGKWDATITAIKESLAQPALCKYGNEVQGCTSSPMNCQCCFDSLDDLDEEPAQEPVARVIDDGTLEGTTEWVPFANRVEPLQTGDLLYTAPQPAQEPVAYLVTGPYEKQAFADTTSAHSYCKGLNKGFGEDSYIVSFLYTAPQQRQWAGLTDEEVREICVNEWGINEWGGYEQCRAIEAKLKEKNT